MKILSIKKNITYFSINKNALIENRRVIRNIITNEIISEIEDASRIICINSEIIILDSLNKGYKTNTSLLLNERIIDIKNNYLLVYSKSPQFYAIYNSELKIVFEERHNFGKHIFGKCIVSGIGESEFINTRIIPDNKTISSFPLSTLGTWLDGAVEKPYQVVEFFGIHKNTLVCTMTSGAVLLLDIETGEVKQFFKDAKVRGGIFQKEEHSPIFMGLKHYTFIEINAETGELIRQVDIQHELKRVANIPNESPCWLGVGTSIYHDGLFYFYGDINFLGVFDPELEKIVDFHWFEFDKKQHQQLKGGVDSLQVKDGKIYSLDTLGNLYELER